MAAEYPACLYWLTDEDLRRQWPIDWPAVTHRYDGPDHRALPVGLTGCSGPAWYYGWDCASGVIWRLSAVESFEPIACEATDKVSMCLSGNDFEEDVPDGQNTR